jgi:molybdopterin-binding protein
MKLSARNVMRGVVSEVHRGATQSVVKVEVHNPAVVSATITNEAVDQLDLRPGAEAVVVIKASDVIVGTD